MAYSNFDTKEINCKILYLGPPGSGKTANFRSILSKTSPDLKSGLFELADTPGAGSYFDFLPVSIGQVRDFHVKLHLITAPTTTIFESLPMVLLRGVDGFVFVADSRVEAMSENVDCLLNFRRLLTDEGFNVHDMPKVFQYNKRDVGDVVPVNILRQELNSALVPDFDAVATKSIGTMETLQAMAKQITAKLARQS